MRVQGHRVPDALRATSDLDEMISHAEIILMVVPTPFVAATMASIAHQLRPDQARALR
jgi:glycerol-3-phosphate dehydrogenase